MTHCGRVQFIVAEEANGGMAWRDVALILFGGPSARQLSHHNAHSTTSPGSRGMTVHVSDRLRRPIYRRAAHHYS